MDRQAALTWKQANIDIPVNIGITLSPSLSLSHLSCSGCIVVHVLEDGDQPELDGEGGGLARDHLQQLGTHVN